MSDQILGSYSQKLNVSNKQTPREGSNQRSTKHPFHNTNAGITVKCESFELDGVSDMDVNWEENSSVNFNAENKMKNVIFLKSEIKEELMDENSLLPADYADDGELSYEDSKGGSSNAKIGLDIDINWKEKKSAIFNSTNEIYEQMSLKSETKNELVDDNSLILLSENIDDTLNASSKIIHTGEKSYQCDVCNKYFTTSSDLKRHNCVHTEVNVNICSPPKKREKKSHLKVCEKNMIINVYKTEMLANSEQAIDEIMKCVAIKTGVCKGTVYKIVKEYKNNRELSAPKTSQNRKAYVLDRIVDFNKEAVRKKVHEFFFRNEFPTIDKILEVVNQDSDLPNFKRTTFYKFLKSLNFKYATRGRKRILIEREEIVLWRRSYLRQLKSYRDEGRRIYYIGETWVNAEHTTGLKNPAGKGKRLIICHIGNENGFVPDSLWAFESKNSGYHEEIDGKSFEKWFLDVLPKLEESAVIVLDNASYHSRKSEKIPTLASQKTDIKTWLSSKNINFNEDMLKVELLKVVKRHKDQYNKYIIDGMAESQGKTVLRLPPYHSELNPIELIWAQIKNDLATKNSTFKFPDIKFPDMKNSLYEVLATITPEKWKKCVEHIQNNLEKQMWELDNIMEINIEPVIISLNDDSDSFSTDLSE